MKKVIFAAMAATTLLYAPLAQAATVFDFTFTGTLATASNDPTFVDGTGKVTVDGLTGIGSENATKGGLSPIITDIDINMSQYHLAFANILTASLATLNGDAFDFSFTGQDTIHNVSFNLDAGPSGLSATAGGAIGYIGTFTVSQEIIGTVPEPATWVMLVLGFGGIGAMLRVARRCQIVDAAA